MTSPCVNETHFDVVGGAIVPKAYMQWRHVASAAVDGLDKTYPPVSAVNFNEVLHTLLASWTNTSPVPQVAYALLTRGGCQFHLNARSRAYLTQEWGMNTGPAPSDPAPTTPHSRFGTGADTGSFTYPDRADFCTLEDRQGPTTSHVGSFMVVSPGSTIKVAFRLKFVSEAWETQGIDYNQPAGAAYISPGDSRLDIYAYPSL